MKKKKMPGIQCFAAPADTQQDRFYGYDGLGQVKDASLGNLNINRTAIAGVPAEKEAFDYDSIGNRKHYLRQAEGATTLDQSRWNNRDNQITALDADADGLAYDAAGNMTACRPDKEGDWTKGCTMVWDAWNRLVQVKHAATSSTVAAYAYDGLTRRTTSTVSSVVRHFYYNNVWKCVEERLGSSSSPERVYYWSARAGHRDELLRRDRATSGGALNETLCCLMDYFDPIAITNNSGVIQERYSYSAFGLASVLTPAFEPRADSSHAWNFLFHGQFRDGETGWDNYGYRYYLPWLGRWPSRDPIGEGGGTNLYAAFMNNCSNTVDLLGLKNDDCLICLYEAHFRSAFRLFSFTWDRGLRGSFLKNQRDSSGPVCGYLGCGANMLNAAQLLSPNGGIRNLPVNNTTANAKHTQEASRYGISATDFQNQGDEAEDLDEAIEAAKEKAREMCEEGCCDSIDIEIKCGATQAKNEAVERKAAGQPTVCNTTINVPCN